MDIALKPYELPDDVDPIRRGVLVRMLLAGWSYYRDTRRHDHHLLLLPPATLGGYAVRCFILGTSPHDLADSAVAYRDALSRGLVKVAVPRSIRRDA